MVNRLFVRATAVSVVGALMVFGLTAPVQANGHAQFSASGPLVFGSQTIGTRSATKVETITNLADLGSNRPLAMGAVTLVGTNSSDFRIVDNHCTGTSVDGQSTCTVSVDFKPTAVGNSTANLRFEFTGIGANPPSPQDVALSGSGTAQKAQAQTPNQNCLRPPRNIKARGLTRLENPGCATNANQRISVIVRAKARGDVRNRRWRVIRLANGSVFIRTFGQRLKLTVRWVAPASPGFAAYQRIKTYLV